MLRMYLKINEIKLEENNGFFTEKKKIYYSFSENSDSDEYNQINESSANSISAYSDINLISNEDNIYSYYILEE